MHKREEHCTHPEQDWCDCDWCRFIRAEGAKRAKRNAARRARHEAYTSLGMKRVKGNLGGTYYE